MTPMVFWPSEVPCARAIIDAEMVCARRNQPAAGSWSARRNSLKTKKIAKPAARPATTGATTAGSRILDTTTEKFTPDTPAPTRTAPISPPNRACEELDGKPNSQVVRFHRIAATKPAKIIVGVTNASLTRPPEIVFATSVDRNAPTTFRIAAISTAVRGRSAPVATDVPIALALSWKPLVKSKNSAVTMTTATRKKVVVIGYPRATARASWSQLPADPMVVGKISTCLALRPDPSSGKGPSSRRWVMNGYAESQLGPTMRS